MMVCAFSAGMQAPEAIHQLPEGGSEPQLFKHRGAQRRDQTAHFENGPLREIPSLFQLADPFGMLGGQGLSRGEAGHWRLSWFAGADPRLANYAGPLGGDIDQLAARLAARLGAPVELDSLPV